MQVYLSSSMKDTCKGMCSQMDDHANTCSRMDKRANMQDVLMDGWMDKHVPFANRRTCQTFQHTSKKQHAKVTSSEPTTIEVSVHFAMQRWSFDTPWGHPLPSNTTTRHAHQQQHECTITVMSSHVIHISIVGHTVYQCNVTWKSKRPTCCTKSHVKLKSPGSQTIMRVVEQPQGLVSPFAINTRSFVHAKGFFTSTPPT